MVHCRPMRYIISPVLDHFTRLTTLSTVNTRVSIVLEFSFPLFISAASEASSSSGKKKGNFELLLWANHKRAI